MDFGASGVPDLSTQSIPRRICSDLISRVFSFGSSKHTSTHSYSAYSKLFLRTGEKDAHSADVGAPQSVSSIIKLRTVGNVKLKSRSVVPAISPSDSSKNPKRTCSVLMLSHPKHCASSCALMITFLLYYQSVDAPYNKYIILARR